MLFKNYKLVTKLSVYLSNHYTPNNVDTMATILIEYVIHIPELPINKYPSPLIIYLFPKISISPKKIKNMCTSQLSSAPVSWSVKPIYSDCPRKTRKVVFVNRWSLMQV